MTCNGNSNCPLLPWAKKFNQNGCKLAQTFENWGTLYKLHTEKKSSHVSLANVSFRVKIGTIKNLHFLSHLLQGKFVLLRIQNHHELYKFLPLYCPLSFLPQENDFWWPGEIIGAMFLQEDEWDGTSMEMFVTNSSSEDNEHISSHLERSIDTETWYLEEQPEYNRDSTYHYCNKTIRVCQDDCKTK